MHRGGGVVANPTLAESQARFVNHHVEHITGGGPPSDPPAEADVHRALTERMWHPLNEQVLLAWNLVERCVDAITVRAGPRSGDGMDVHARNIAG